MEKIKMPKNRYKIWIIGTLSLMVFSLIAIVSVTVYIDPFFHYHAPLKKYQYPINDERYQNDGITKNFAYNAIITGTSMTENFKKSEADKIFNANFIKVPFSGGRYKEINDNLIKAYNSWHEIKYVIRCLDYSSLILDKDARREGTDYPEYLYNDNPFDDIRYVLNKSILLNRTLDIISYTSNGNKTTSFDDYANWNDSYTFGAETVLGTYTLGEQSTEKAVLSKEEETMVIENINQNVTELARIHPETTFYLFFPPYSICYWDELNNTNEIDKRIDAEEIAIKEMLEYSNIRLYSFCDNYELICNLDNYKDLAHYGEWVNSWILEWMYKGKNQLTKSNYKQYIENIRNFYNSYDYASLHQ